MVAGPALSRFRRETDRVVSAETLRRMEQTAGVLTTRAVGAMETRLSWFRTLPAEHRAWVSLVAQAGIAGFPEWLGSGYTTADGRGPTAARTRLTEAIFANAPRELVRAVSFRHTVELVRVAISVAEDGFPALAASDPERLELTDALLRYSREVAFSAATIYAVAAESRGAWDQRLEALVVDAIVRGEGGEALESRAAALNWDSARTTTVLVGAPGGSSDPATIARRPAAVLSGIHGDRLVVVAAAPDADAAEAVAAALLPAFGPGPVVRGPVDVGLAGAIRSAAESLSAYRAAAAWPDAPRMVTADALLPERVLAGEPAAREQLLRRTHRPLSGSPTPLLPTLERFLGRGRSLEGTARELFVHVNTVRYRLRRVLELTGLDPTDPRDALTLQLGIMLGRLDEAAR